MSMNKISFISIKWIAIGSIIFCGVVGIFWYYQPKVVDLLIVNNNHKNTLSSDEKVIIITKSDSAIINNSSSLISPKAVNQLLIQKIIFLQEQVNEIKKEKGEDILSQRGTFGDMFGSLNTLFSGLGMVGLLATILIQISIHLYEKNEKLKIENSKIIFINSVMSKFKNEFLLKIKPSLTNILDILDGEIAYFNSFKPEEYDIALLSVLKKIDFEEYFILFESEKKNGTNLLLIQTKLLELQLIADNFMVDKDAFFLSFDECYQKFNMGLNASILMANTDNGDYLKYYDKSIKSIKEYLPVLKTKGNENRTPIVLVEFNKHFEETITHFDKMCELVRLYRVKLKGYEKTIDETISYIPSST